MDLSRIDPRRALAAYGSAGRIFGPRCASLGCGHVAEWTGQMRIWSLDRTHGPLAIMAIPRVCSECSVHQVRSHVMADSFFNLVVDFAKAARMPAPDRSTFEAEFATL